MKNIIIIGTNNNAELIANEITAKKKQLKMNLIGFIDDENQKENTMSNGIYKIYKYSEIKEIINNIQIVIIAANNITELPVMNDIISDLPSNIKIYNLPDFYEKITHKFFISPDTIKNLFYRYVKERSRLYDMGKRILDVIFSIIIFLIALPALIYAAIRVKITDGDNPIYTQTRIGKNRKPFKVYKLRTMYKNTHRPNDNEIEYCEKQDNDDRIIPFCKYIRKIHLDEVPQMINIIKGDMSLVGPRAEWKDLVEIYTKQIPYYNCRYWADAGLSGWAQINQGHCIKKEDIAEKLQYDLYYIKHRNLLWEMGIYAKTILMALGGRLE